MKSTTENIIVYILTTIVVLGLFYMSDSFHSLWGLLMLLCVNTTTTTTINKKE